MSEVKPSQEGKFYWRYFRVDDPEFDQKLQDMNARREELSKQWQALTRSVGATNLRTWTHDGKFAGFLFDTQPCAETFKQVGEMYVPKRNTKKGKELWKLINEIPQEIINPNMVLKDYGLIPGVPMDNEDGQAFYATVVGFYEPGIWFVKVPSRHFGVATLEAAKQVFEETGSLSELGDPRLVNALWQPPAAWVLVKQWEFIREWDELAEKYS